MHFVSVQFLLFVALSLFSFHATRSLAFRKTVLFASNLWFVAYLTAAPRLMLPTAVFLVSGFVLVRLLQARQQQKLLAVAVVLAVASFVYLVALHPSLHSSPRLANHTAPSVFPTSCSASST